MEIFKATVETSDRGCFEEIGNRQVDAQGTIDAANQYRGEHRLPIEVEEAVIRTRLGNAECLGEQRAHNFSPGGPGGPGGRIAALRILAAHRVVSCGSSHTELGSQLSTDRAPSGLRPRACAAGRAEAVEGPRLGNAREGVRRRRAVRFRDWRVHGMDRHSPTRRDRLRLQMLTDIIAMARMQLWVGGANAISVRAIAREVGVTPAAIYRYFPSLNALICTMQDEILNELCAEIESARDQSADESPAIRLGAMARTFRKWALDHPAEFRFALGTGQEQPGKTSADHGKPSARILKLASIFLAEFARPLQHRAASRTFLSVWVKLYGLVTIEVSGDLKWMLADIEDLFEIMMAELDEQLPHKSGPP